MSEDLEVFLEPAPGIQCDHQKVRDLARQVAKGASDDVEAARSLFYFVRDTVRYSVYVPFERLEDYLALNTLERGFGYCVQKGALLCALARSLGIPARLAFADIKNDLLPDHMDRLLPGGIIRFHCFLEWWLKDRWLKSTPSFDAQLSRNKGWRLVEFSASEDAMLPSQDLEGRPHVSYLAYHGWRLGVPLEEFLEVTRRCYGSEGVKLWRDMAEQGPAQSKDKGP
ncbi:MAG: transglutaminase-like domain-containing protein [Desulfarculaceae bacterium]|jgi:hypothetical protein